MNREPKKFPKKTAALCPGAFACIDSESPLDDEGGYGDPHQSHLSIEALKPDFVNEDEEGWEKLSPPLDR